MRLQMTGFELTGFNVGLDRLCKFFPYLVNPPKIEIVLEGLRVQLRCFFVRGSAFFIIFCLLVNLAEHGISQRKTFV